MIQPPQSEIDPTAGPNPDGSLGGGGRWYPTLIALPDQTVAAFGGHPEEADRRHSNYSVEVFQRIKPLAVVGDLQARNPKKSKPPMTLFRGLKSSRACISCLTAGSSWHV